MTRRPYTAADRAFDLLQLSKGGDESIPWGREAEALLATAELAEATARSRAAQAVSQGADRLERERTRAILCQASALTLALAKRKQRGNVSRDELGRAQRSLGDVQSGEMTRAEVVDAERARIAQEERRYREVEEELEEAGSVAEMGRALAAALLAENHRADAHYRRLTAGKKDTDHLAPAANAAGYLVGRSYRALEEWHNRRDAGAVVTTGEWRAAVGHLAAIRADMEELEYRLRLGCK